MPNASSAAPFSAGRRRFLAAGATAAAAIGWPGIRAVRADDFVLTAAAATKRLEAAHGVPVYTYNGSVPGPELRIRQGRTLRVRLKNRLDVDTTVHWHGIRIANAMDGVPELTQDAVAPGAEFEYGFTVPDAGTYWYHSHRFSFEQVERGLYGLLVVDEAQPYPVDRDIPLVVDDWRLTGDGAIDPLFGDLHDISHAGRLGNWITVNGASLPDIDVAAGERIRLRVANTANARIVTLHFKGHSPWVIALDGQPVAPFTLGGGKLTLAPGQRTDLVLDVATAAGSRTPIDLVDQRGVLTIAHLSARGDTGTARSDPPPALPVNPLDTNLDLDAAIRAELTMSGGAMGNMQSARFEGRQMPIRELVEHDMAWSMNGVAGMGEAPLFTARRGRTVIIDLFNDNRWPHAMHVHGHHFRVIERNGEPLPDSPWRDTTLVQGFDRIRMAFVADNPGRWMLHCHMLEHAAGGMMTWFEVA